MIEPDIIGFNGPPRSGKTAGLTAWGLWYKRFQHKKGFTNYDIDGFETITPYDFLHFLKMGAEHAENSPLFDAVFCGQEFQTWLESRVGTSKAAVAMTDVVCQAPKLGIKLGYDAQLNSSVDKRLKQNASVRFECEKRKNGFRYWFLDLNYTEENVRTGKKVFMNLDYMTKSVFPFYNTRKVSLRPDFDNTLMELERQDPKLMIKTVDRQVDLLWTDRTYWCKTGVANVKYALSHMGEPIGFADQVAIGLELKCYRSNQR